MTSTTTSNLRGIWVSSSTDIFAVGYDGVILHYDGAAWAKMSVATSTYFQAVWGSAANDVYAVGHPLFKPDESTFHYDGTSWTKMSPPDSLDMEGIRGTSKSDVWAVGSTHREREETSRRGRSPVKLMDRPPRCSSGPR